MAPRPKGGARVTVRVSSSHVEYYREEAKRRGIPLSDYLAERLAAAHNFSSECAETSQHQLQMGA